MKQTELFKSAIKTMTAIAQAEAGKTVLAVSHAGALSQFFTGSWLRREIDFLSK